MSKKIEQSKQRKTADAQFAALDKAIARGITDADAGRVKSVGEVFDRLETKYRRMPTNAQPK